METIATDRKIRVNSVARRLGISERMVRVLVAQGRLPATRGGRKLLLFDIRDVEAFGRIYASTRRARRRLELE